MKVAIYARVSTSDKDQDPETQLLAIRQYCAAQGWEITETYVDHASARDLLQRTAWRDLLAAVGKRTRGFDAVVVFKLDRAFRSVKEMHDTLAAWDAAKVGFNSVREHFDTKTALGRLMISILGALAEFELETIRERVIAGMDRAKEQGHRLGRPPLSARKGFVKRFAAIVPSVLQGEISNTEAAERLGISVRSFRRWMTENQERGT